MGGTLALASPSNYHIEYAKGPAGFIAGKLPGQTGWYCAINAPREDFVLATQDRTGCAKTQTPSPQRRPGPAPKQERVFGRDRPRNGVLFVPRSRTPPRRRCIHKNSYLLYQSVDRSVC